MVESATDDTIVPDANEAALGVAFVDISNENHVVLDATGTKFVDTSAEITGAFDLLELFPVVYGCPGQGRENVLPDAGVEEGLTKGNFVKFIIGICYFYYATSHEVVFLIFLKWFGQPLVAYF